MNSLIGDVIKEEQTEVFNFNKHEEEKRYAVVLHNDDITPFEFVILSLITIFQMNSRDAQELTMKIHMEGKGIAGVYSMDVAYAKVDALDAFKQTFGFHLLATVEEAD